MGVGKISGNAATREMAHAHPRAGEVKPHGQPGYVVKDMGGLSFGPKLQQTFCF